MKLIPLTQDCFAQVDDEDFENISRYKWCAHKASHSRNTYAKRKIWVDGKSVDIRMHREITSCPKDMEVDHIDHNGLNNQKSNLRVCSLKDNRRNRRLQKNSSSKYIGVNKMGKKFAAKIWSNNKTIFLGSFSTEVEAAIAYDRAALMFRGDFAKLNFNTASKPVEGK